MFMVACGKTLNHFVYNSLEVANEDNAIKLMFEFIKKIKTAIYQAHPLFIHEAKLSSPAVMLVFGCCCCFCCGGVTLHIQQ